MKYSKYNDISALLIELCNSFNDDELKMLALVGEKMSNDSTFDRFYTLEVKSRYLKNIRDIKSGKYIPIDFAELNNQICNKIENNDYINIILLPEYAKFDHLDNKKDKKNLVQAQNLKHRIEKLHKHRNL